MLDIGLQVVVIYFCTGAGMDGKDNRPGSGKLVQGVEYGLQSGWIIRVLGPMNGDKQAKGSSLRLTLVRRQWGTLVSLLSCFY